MQPVVLKLDHSRTERMETGVNSENESMLKLTLLTADEDVGAVFVGTKVDRQKSMHGGAEFKHVLASLDASCTRHGAV